jgi:lysophospholipase L1-like esterase
VLDAARRAAARLPLPGRPLLRVGLAVVVAVVAVVLVAVSATSAAGQAPPPVAALPATGPVPADHPIVVLGASISAGTGSTPEQAWPALLGRCLGRRVIVGAVPGAGYVATGRDSGGPVVRLLRESDLKRLDPSLVMLQAGHNDIGTPAPKLTEAVTTAIGTVNRDAPQARVAVITVFAHVGVPTAEARSTDAVIVGAAQRADPHVIVLDPLTEDWSFPRVADGLHPTEIGQRIVATHVIDGLALAGVTGPGSCSGGTGAPAGAPGPTGAHVSLTPS